MMQLPLLFLPPNRVRRNYVGGALLDAWECSPNPHDGYRPEDWIASTVNASNPGLPLVVEEGLARVTDSEGRFVKLIDVFAAAPEYYLGSAHVDRLGKQQLGFLAKLLDSAMRLHVQAHPTTAFARRHLASRWGKLEAYVILGVRDGCDPYIRLGFQRPPSPQEWHRIVLEQDIAAMDACFDRIPVRVGEVWLVPGGLPHAIGEGVLMLEVMEPTDLVVRCEFEREGIIVPPEARFMQQDPNLALQIFDYTPLSVSQVQERYRIKPHDLSQCEEQLIGPKHTESFSISKITTDRAVALPSTDRLRIGVVATGYGTVSVADQQMTLRPGSHFLLAAAAPVGRLTPAADQVLQVLFCAPG